MDEEAIEKIAKLIYMEGEDGEPPGWEFLKKARENYEGLARLIINTLKSLGYVQLDIDQSLPKNPYPQTTITSSTGGIMGRHGYDQSQQDILKQNFKKVKE